MKKATRKAKAPDTAAATLPPFSGAALVEAMTDFVGTLTRGKAHTLRTTDITVPAPLPVRTAAEVRAVRDGLGVSQAVFAGLLNVPVTTVISWENSQRKPSGAALKLLDIAARHPEVLTGQVRVR